MIFAHCGAEVRNCCIFPNSKSDEFCLSEICRLGQQKAMKYCQTCPQNGTSSKKLKSDGIFPLSSSLCKRDRKKVRKVEIDSSPPVKGEFTGKPWMARAICLFCTKESLDKESEIRN